MTARSIDLHLHTTASDGRYAPAALVRLAHEAGLAIIAITDHDTMAGVPEAQEQGHALGLDVIAGIEITAVEHGSDIHMLGYFLDPGDARIQAFLARQRLSRRERVAALAARLAELGMPIDLTELDAVDDRSGRSIGRPQVARAMIAAGHVATVQEAFDRWLAHGRPAFVPRTGPTPEPVIEVVHASGGLVSLAHPGRTRIDGRIGELAQAGLDALEVYHTDHEPSDVQRYLGVAQEHELLVSGGSDFHGDPGKARAPGTTTLPQSHWETLNAARYRHA